LLKSADDECNESLKDKIIKTWEFLGEAGENKLYPCGLNLVRHGTCGYLYMWMCDYSAEQCSDTAVFI
jgi:hypothetical protein